ncbi:MAG: BACON domain-containing protein, partial [Acidobacteria bacterium]|nr:BACON domain-containing protein [Acidobacteriota bacterium]
MFPTPRFALLWLMLWTTALGAQSLVVSPLELNFIAELGQPSPATQTFTIQSTPAGQSFSARVNRNLLVNPAWLLDPFPTNGQTPATLTVTVDTQAFTAPTQGTADIIVTSGGEQQVVKVTLSVTQPSQPPSIATAPSALSFNVQAPGLAGAAQDLIVSNGGGGFLDYTMGVTYPAGQAQNWLQITPMSGQLSFGSRVHQIQVPDTSGLVQGTYSATIRIQSTSATNSPLLIPVTLTVGQASALVATPASLSFFAAEGGTSPEDQTLTIGSSGGVDSTYSITSNQPWLTVTPASGRTTGESTHQIAATAGGMSSGVYLANLTIQGPLGSLQVAVQLVVGTLSAQPPRLDFLGNSGIPIRERRSISLVNTPLGAGVWSVKVTPSNATWLKVSPGQGRVPARLQVEVDTTGLGQDNLEAAIEITPARGSGSEGVQQSGPTITVPVRATILAGPPHLAALPQALLFRSTEGLDGALEQALLVDNTGGPQLLWQSEVTVESGDWLSLSRVSGEAPTQTLVVADTAGLTTGTYHGRIRLFAGDQSVNVPVVLSVASAGASLDTDVSALYWEMVEGGTPPASREVQVLNRGAGTMNWTATIAEVSSSQQWF